MSSGLDNILRPIEVSKEDWVNYNGIMMPKKSAAGKKARDTIRVKEQKQSYNRIKKNQVRNTITNIIKKNVPKKSNILTLDTEQYLFTNELKDYNLFLCEKDINKYKKMLNNKPSNVSFLHHGNIEELDAFKNIYEVVYLDLCSTFETAKPIIKELIYKLKGANYFGFTFCLRKNKKKLKDYKFDMIKKIQDFFSKECVGEFNGYKFYIQSELVYGESYRDKYHAPMITIFYKNNTKKNIDVYLRTLDFVTIKKIAKEEGIL